jgi:ornithine carbamoyltransferase
MNLMSKAKKDAIFLHCLPAHRGEEIDNIILESDHSFVWQQAHNRLYSSMALIEFLLTYQD